MAHWLAAHPSPRILGHSPLQVVAFQRSAMRHGNNKGGG